MSTPPALRLRDVSVAYDESAVLAHVTLDIRAGEFVGVVGPNGAGKSSLLNAILDLAPHTRGQILVNGRKIAEARREVAYMPQREVVDWTFPVSIDDVVMMGRQARIGWFRRPSSRDRKVVEWALEQVQMLETRDAPIGNLSGGQQQRVFLARALAQEGNLLLLDEPLTGVDATTQETILKLLQEFQGKGQTVIMTTHDLGVAYAFCTKLLFLNRGVIAYGKPVEVFKPEILRKTYGGHILRLNEAGGVLAPLNESLMVLVGDTHHDAEDVRGDKR